MMAARQSRPSRAPPLQQDSSEPPIFIPLDTPATAEQQPPHTQHSEAAHSQKPPRKKPLVQNAQDSFRTQRREVHESRRAFQEQREALGMSAGPGAVPGRQTQAPSADAAAKELRQSLRDVYFDMTGEGSHAGSSSSDKAPKATRDGHKPANKKNMGQEESMQGSPADRRHRSSRASMAGSQRRLGDEERPASSSRPREASPEGARAARRSGSSFQRGPEAARLGAGIGRQPQSENHSRRRERDRVQDDVSQSGRREVTVDPDPQLSNVLSSAQHPVRVLCDLVQSSRTTRNRTVGFY